MNNWTEYNKKVERRKPSSALMQALASAHKGLALDMGAGSLVDTHYLLDQCYKVTAMDFSDSSKEYAAKIQNPDFTFIQSRFEDFQFGKYDLINANYSLPFCAPDKIDAVVEKIKESLNPGGVFVGQFFGPNDDWAMLPGRNFQTKKKIEEYFSDLEMLSLNEDEHDGVTAAGAKKHWHVFTVIAKKMSV